MFSPFDVAWAILKNDTRKLSQDLLRHRRALAQEARQREEASYANISIPRESPIHGLEPFGQDEAMGTTIDPMENMMIDDILEPIRQRQREQEPPNPFTVKPSSPRFARPGSRSTPLTSKTTQRRMQ